MGKQTHTTKKCSCVALPENHLPKWSCSAMNNKLTIQVTLFSSVAPSGPANHISHLTSTVNVLLQEDPHIMHLYLSTLFLGFSYTILYIMSVNKTNWLIQYKNHCFQKEIFFMNFTVFGTLKDVSGKLARNFFHDFHCIWNFEGWIWKASSCPWRFAPLRGCMVLKQAKTMVN